MAFSFPVELCLPVVLHFLALRAFPLVRDSTDGWYSLADAAGADDEGVFGSTASSSSRTYASPLARFCAAPVSSIDLIRPLLLVVVDDNVDARLGALRLAGSEHVTAGAWIERSIPLTGLCADWRIDSPIALASVLPTTKVGSASSGWGSWTSCISVSSDASPFLLLAGWPELSASFDAFVISPCGASPSSSIGPSLLLAGWSELVVLVDTPGLFGGLRPHPELSLVEVPEPLPPELPGPTVVAAGVPCLASLIERYAGTRWCRSLACARACTLSISLMKSGHRFDHPLCAPPQLAHFRSLRVASFLRWQSRE